jgi:uncharacterized protein YmfQ (DUF2313 family)
MTTQEAIQELTRKLYPKGRAFKFPFGGVGDRVIRALSVSEATAYDDAIGLLNAILPDNPDFTAEDALEWERRLGLITNTALTLDQRKAALIRKINHPGTIKPRQAQAYIEGQLQASGFNVFVFENIPAQDPVDVMAAQVTGSNYGSFNFGGGNYGSATDIATNTLITPLNYGGFNYGQASYGGNYNNKVMNYLEPSLDLTQSQGINFRASFFIGGDPVGTFANVDATRETEFRQLILKLKPVHTVAFLYINYV